MSEQRAKEWLESRLGKACNLHGTFINYPKLLSDYAASEVATAQERIKVLEEALRELVAGMQCEHIHHKKSEYHEGLECPVINRYAALLTQEPKQ